jgi:hypothetical protein
MDYPLENLGPERFQQLCQALLANEQPDIQCFPVGQPDGGRDALRYVFPAGSRKFAIFQVKYSRRPLAETDPHKWLLAVIEDEIPKINRLIPKGAIKYYLLTNIPGTSHSDTGAIDGLDRILTNTLHLPFVCWWRDDLNRRLDTAWSVKWSYPELMTGPDFLRALIESGLTEHRERRSASIKAFLRHQFELDDEVKFKQVELQNKLLDLFIDVPMSLREMNTTRRRTRERYHFTRALHYRMLSSAADQSDSLGAIDREFESQQQFFIDPEEPLGAASLLLSASFQSNFEHVVVEGAPGQGKSTIAQYVCQVHRMRLLHEDDLLDRLPVEHTEQPLRLPIRVDLRDFATWLNKRNPFNSDEADQSPPGWQKISEQSGGAHFSVDDLLAVARISSLLIVFDGLDEVVDIASRREVVDEIVRGTHRLKENSASFQSIVTSRPASFANSPGMPPERYIYFQLLDLNLALIHQYADRWIRAKRLDSRLASEFRGILKERLDQPHLRDLARNPMQLAILLSLILTKGASLPDKRTAL